MEPSVKKVPNKKVFFVAVAVFGVVLLFALVSMASSVSRKPQNSVESSIQKNVEKSEVSGSSPVPSAIVQIPADWKTYQNSQFSINYPPDWQAEELKFPNGDSGTTFHALIASASSPSMLITVTSGSANSIQEKQKAYMSTGFKSSNVLVDNKQAVKLSGVITGSVSSDPEKKVIEANHIYLREGNNDYLLKYTYLDKSVNSELESLFNRIIASFKLN